MDKKVKIVIDKYINSEKSVKIDKLQKSLILSILFLIYFFFSLNFTSICNSLGYDKFELLHILFNLVFTSYSTISALFYRCK